MGAAMDQVRQALGPDALIVMTRHVADGIEVTAALDPPAAMADERHDLAWHGVPDAFLNQPSLEEYLTTALRWAPLDNAGAVLVVGPPGAGKTLTVARLATRLVLAGTPPAVLSADGRRAGAAEELAAFTRQLDLPLVMASTPRLVTRALARHAPGTPVLIDTPGTDPWVDSALLTDLAAAADARITLVLPAGLDGHEASDIAGAYAALGATTMVATRLDLARRRGSVLWAAQHVALAGAGVGPGAGDGLLPFTPSLLCSILRVPGVATPGEWAQVIVAFSENGDGGRRKPA